MLIPKCAGSINRRLSSMQAFRFFFDPLQLHREVADLLIQARCQRLVCFLLPALSRREHLGNFIQQLFLPLRNLGGMHSIFRCQFIGRLLSPNRFQGNFGFDIRALSLSLCFHSILSFPLGLTQPFYLISLSSFWGLL